MVALVMPVLLTGCKDDKSIKIWQEDGISQVKRGQELVIDMDLKKIELSSIEFFVDGSAIITNEGKLTVNTNATVGSQIKVTAKSEKDNVTSNELVFVVVDLLAFGHTWGMQKFWGQRFNTHHGSDLSHSSNNS